MNYFDTDVLTNASVEQDSLKYIQSNDIIERAVFDETFKVSWLCIQELGFVLAKLGKPNELINISLNQLISSLPLNYNPDSFQRAIELANIVGFKNFNDCLHTAIAEQYCTDFYTYNRSDFKKIEPLTHLKIHLL